jgi:invasion protein IalB
MQNQRPKRLAFALLAVAAGATIPARGQPAPAPGAASPARPSKAKPKAAAKPAAAVTGAAHPTLLGQYGDWGAYAASPGGKKVCFVVAKPTSAETNPPDRPRDPAYMFVSTRPADKVKDEVSIIVGYPLKPKSEASADVGSTSFALYTQQDGAWIKNAAEEANMVNAMRAGQTAVVKGVSAKGTQSTDTYSLRGLAQALDRSDQDCR